MFIYIFACFANIFFWRVLKVLASNKAPMNEMIKDIVWAFNLSYYVFKMEILFPVLLNEQFDTTLKLLIKFTTLYFSK